MVSARFLTLGAAAKLCLDVHAGVRIKRELRMLRLVVLLRKAFEVQGKGCRVSSARLLE